MPVLTIFARGLLTSHNINIAAAVLHQPGICCIVDTADVDAQHLLTSETQLGIELFGPVPSDSSWQEKAKQGFELSGFTVDWEHHHAICRQGNISQSWHPRSDNYGNRVIQVR
ncbi:hypothetical protein QUA56_24560 [Microcoleus sp. N3A4]|uniref:hypothetical protein n=1 Tax=Microcoleus sp. N3A4 TaxID=3055379 RepID=UPI002FCE98A7